METQSSNLKRSIYIGLALVAGIIIALIIITLATGYEVAEDSKETAIASPTDDDESKETAIASPTDDDEVVGEENPDSTYPSEESSLEAFQNYLLTTTDGWVAKSNRLRLFIYQHNPPTTACADIDGSWSGWITARQSATGGIRTYLDAVIAYFDGVDAEAFSEELLVATEAGGSSTIEITVVFAKYGLNFGDYANLSSKLEVQNKLSYTDDQLCAYDIDYNLPE